jgi:hypothetical protein
VDDDTEQKRKAGRIGGARRAELLSPKKRVEIARRAAETRWGGRPARATHKGSFREQLAIDVDCYVLDDAQKTAVISRQGMVQALGLSSRGTTFPGSLTTKSMSEIAGPELQAKLENPRKFQWRTGGAERPPATIHGFDVTLLMDLSNAIIAAENGGTLPKRHQRIARQAQIIVAAAAKSGIKQLVYSLAGYDPRAEEVIAAFKLYIQEEAQKYEPEFPNELFREWYRLYDIPVPSRSKPWHFQYLTVNHIYYPLAESNGNLYALSKALKAKGRGQEAKLFEFLNQIGARALRLHLGRVLEMAESSPDRNAYECKIKQRFGGYQDFNSYSLRLHRSNQPRVCPKI